MHIINSKYELKEGFKIGSVELHVTGLDVDTKKDVHFMFKGEAVYE